jgi:hypothetical protein
MKKLIKIMNSKMSRRSIEFNANNNSTNANSQRPYPGARGSSQHFKQRKPTIKNAQIPVPLTTAAPPFGNHSNQQ